MLLHEAGETGMRDRNKELLSEQKRKGNASQTAGTDRKQEASALNAD